MKQGDKYESERNDWRTVTGDQKTERIDSNSLDEFYTDDNELYTYFLQFLAKNRELHGVYHQNFEERLIIRITNKYHYPQSNVPFKIIDQNGKILWRGSTSANGEGVVYPNMMFVKTPQDLMFLEVEYAGRKFRQGINKTKSDL